MAIQTIEQFIERSKHNCRVSAEIAVKRRYMDSIQGTEPDENARKSAAAEHIRTPEGIKAVEEQLGKSKFYKQLCAENAAQQPRVESAYRKYTESGASGVSAAEKEEKRRNSRKRKKENNRRNKRNKREEYYERFTEYEFSDDDRTLAAKLLAEMIVRHYSDLRSVFPARYMHELTGEFVTANDLERFRRRVYDESTLNMKRLNNVIYNSEYPCGNIDELFFYIASVRVLEGSEYGDTAKRSMIRDFIGRGRARCKFSQLTATAIIKRFDRDTLYPVITGSDSYRRTLSNIQAQISASESAHKLIMKEIPEDVTLLYPGARKMRRRFILHLGPTNSGKTYQSLEACRKAETGVYLAPLRLLAYEICEKFNLEGVPCRMITGEEEIDIPFAKHTSSTVEMLNPNEHYDVAVVDECQLIEDEERGGAWTAAILGLMAEEIHLCAAENAKNILISLIKLCGDDWQIVEHQRTVPLKCDPRPFVFPRDVEREDALIAFTKKGVLHYAEQLKRIGVKASVIYGDLPYDVRRSEVARFVHGETDVVVATDAVGMGLNLPIKRVVFLEAYKYDGHRRRFLHGTEIKQIAGRAGRMGMYDVGYYNAAEFKGDIIRKLGSKSHDVTRARLRIPESILVVDMPLSEILLRWGTIPDDGLFTKNSVEREVNLARDLERYSQDKLLNYRFVTIPFAETRKELYDFWFELFECEVNNDRRSVHTYINRIEQRGSGLEDHELAYRKCDILYFYYDRFGVKEDLEAIMELKHAISADIMAILSDTGTSEPGEDEDGK